MCSSRIDRERGCVVITAPGGESGYEVGVRFWLAEMEPLPGLRGRCLGRAAAAIDLGLLEPDEAEVDARPQPEKVL